MIDAQFARVLQLSRRDVIFYVKTVKPTSKYKSGLLVTYHKNNPPYRNWIDQAARETLYRETPTDTPYKSGWNVTYKRNIKCQACDTNKFHCKATSRTYQIRSNFTFQCDTSWCIYYASGTGGLGAHYFEHHGGSTNTMQITIIDLVATGNHSALNYKEEFWISMLRTMDTMGYGGLNLREELERGREMRGVGG